MPETLEKKIFLICPVRNATEQDKAATNAYIAKLEAKGKKVHYPPRDTDQNDPGGLNICRTNRQAMIDSDEVHVYWTPGSEGSKFDLGMAFMADKPTKFVNGRDYIRATQESFENFLLELDIDYYLPREEIPRQGHDNSIYFVCPSHGLNEIHTRYLEDLAKFIATPAQKVYYPPKDAPKGLIGIGHFHERRKAMQKACEVRVFWDCSNIDNYFELGMAFMEEKAGKPIRLIESIPPTDGKKSFNNVLRALDEIYKKPQ
jgi:hypothetical protein